jgi:hypothetical protein
MKRLFAAGIFVAFGAAVFAQTTAQTPAQPQPQTTEPTAQSAPQAHQTASGTPITISGCVQSETDYRRARNLGRGGVVGTGVGAANEFMLISASTAKSETSGTSGGTLGDAYELTGKNEKHVAPYVGKHVEIVGVLKAAAVGTSGPTGGATAGQPPTGVDTVSPDLRLRELEVTSVRETQGTCASAPR